MKKIITVAGVVVVALIIIALIGLFYLGPIVKAGIEKFGPQITKVSVTVDSADVSLLGSATINGLVVGNPQGYTSAQAIKVGTVSVSLEPLSVLSQKIVIHSMRVNAPQITFESSIFSDNLNTILNNVNGSSKGPQPPAPKIEIDDLVITGAQVSIDIKGVISKTVPLPDIHLTDLGKGSDGLTPVEITRAVLTSLLKSTATAVASSAGGVSQTVSNTLGNLFGSK